MIIASQCEPFKGYKNREGWIPEQPWAEDVFVQWGNCGVVFSRKKGAYTTAFFEAFPNNPKTFIRGEGKDVPEAELDAFKKYQRYLACPEHEFEARGYTNGSGICKHCGLFMSKVFPPHLICKHCGKAIHEGFDDIHGNVYCEECEEKHGIPKEDWTEEHRAYQRDMEAHRKFMEEIKSERRKNKETKTDMDS